MAIKTFPGELGTWETRRVAPPNPTQTGENNMGKEEKPTRKAYLGKYQTKGGTKDVK